MLRLLGRIGHLGRARFLSALSTLWEPMNPMVTGIFHLSAQIGRRTISYIAKKACVREIYPGLDRGLLLTARLQGRDHTPHQSCSHSRKDRGLPMLLHAVGCLRVQQHMVRTDQVVVPGASVASFASDAHSRDQSASAIFKAPLADVAVTRRRPARPLPP